MFSASLSNSSGLVVRYDFSADNIKKGAAGANGIARVIVRTLCDFHCVWCMVAGPFVHCIATVGIWWSWHKLFNIMSAHL